MVVVPDAGELDPIDLASLDHFLEVSADLDLVGFPELLPKGEFIQSDRLAESGVVFRYLGNYLGLDSLHVFCRQFHALPPDKSTSS